MTMDQPKSNKFVIPIGPQHPALKEPGHFEFTIDGEVITAASIRLGYVHRAIEKTAESRTWVQALYLMERICGICSHVHAMTFVMGVEQLAGVQASPRAAAIRTLTAELERIHSHLLWFGVGAHEGGFDTLFMYSWRDREIVMDLLEKLSGNRVNYSLNVLGGVKYDISAELAAEIHKGLDTLEERTHYYLNVITTDESFLGRTEGIGVMDRQRAKELGVVGPTARASNVNRDVRTLAPYAGYVDFPVNVVLDNIGDLKARFVVRVRELFESYRLVRVILDNLPAGELTTRVPRRIPAGEVICRSEAPRGELFYYIESDGSDTPARVKVRTPSLCNWSSMMTLVIGHQLADVPMILAGIDPCFSCNDRMVRIRDRQNDRLWSWSELRQHGIEAYR